MPIPVIYKKCFTLVLFLSLYLCANVHAQDLHFLAGAGLRGPVDIVVKEFEKETGIHVAVEYGGSGKLMARYNVSGKGDLFMPGDYYHIDLLKKKQKIKTDIPLLFHTPVIAFNRKKDPGIQSVQDLGKPGLRLALGDPKAMALGRTADEILKRSGAEESILKNLKVYGATVKQLALYVAQGAVDASIIARADAFQFRDKIGYIPIPQDLYTPARIGIAVFATSEKLEDALKFQAYIARRESIRIFMDAGFLPINNMKKISD